MTAPTTDSSTPRALRSVQCRHQLPLTLTRLAGLLGARSGARGARVAAVPVAVEHPAVILADRGADADPGALGVAGLVAVQVVRFGAAEPLGVPALSVIAQVVVDIGRVAAIAPIGRRAPGP